MKSVYQGLFMIFILFLVLFAFQGNSIYAADKDDNFIEKTIVIDEVVMVGLGELYYGVDHFQGNLRQLDGDEKYEKTVLRGRLAFYLKGKIKGRYLLKAWLDTGEEPLDEILSNLSKKQSVSIYDKLDPDKYYPVYGDNSTTVNTVDTSGHFYLCLESEEFKAILGNYRASLHENQLISYNRSLYGLAVNYEQNLALESFWSQPTSFYSRDVLQYTGGMLYYFKNSDIVIGSETIELEIHSSITDRVLETIQLSSMDYTINYLQGRLILNKKLDSLIANSDLIDEFSDTKIYLVAEYEYDYRDISFDNNSYGLEGSYQLTDDLNFAVTYLREEDEDPYDIYGLMLDYQNKEDFRISISMAESRDTLIRSNFSSDGGLNYQEIIPGNGGDTGDRAGAQAYKVEISSPLVNIFAYNKDTNKEDISKDDTYTGAHQKNGSLPGLKLGTFYEYKEDGFSSAGNTNDGKQINYGLLLDGDLSKSTEFSTVLEKKETDSEDTSVYRFQLNHQYNQKLSLDGEIRYKGIKKEGEGPIENEEQSKSFDTIGALGFDYRLSDSLGIYGSQQMTIGKSDGQDDNNKSTLGAEYSYDRYKMKLEGSSGSRGNSILLGGSYLLNDKFEIYTELEEKSPGKVNNSDDDNRQTITTFGAKTSVSDSLNLYGEHRISDKGNKDSSSNILGMEYQLTDNWLLALDYSKSSDRKVKDRSTNNNDDYDDGDTDRDNDYNSIYNGGVTDREIMGVGLSYGNNKTSFSNRAEYRRDRGKKELKQVIMTGKLDYLYNDELTLLAEYDYSRSYQSGIDRDLESYLKGTIGLAYRPIITDKFNLLAKYSYLEDLLAGLGGTSNDSGDGVGDDDLDNDINTGEQDLTAEIAQVLALEGIYDIDTRWQLAGKIAYKIAELERDKNSSNWLKSETYLWVNRLNYNIIDYDIFLEYRVLKNTLAKDQKSGYLLGVYRDMGNNLKLGLGYNFTDFNDDLTKLSYDAGGLFINVVKKW